MANNKSSNKEKKPPAVKVALRPVDKYFAEYSEDHQNPNNKLIHWICLPLVVFSLFGLVWAIPFPYLKFMGTYNGYFNWASFLIAFGVYYYYRLSPMLSYTILLVLMLCSFGATELAEWHKAGGPALWLVCGVLFITGVVGLSIGNRMEGKKAPVLFELMIGPVWLLHFILKRFKMKY
jgi:uncharacterized membrane protein YGL010W